ncbi:ATP-binding protein [Streptomyces syringium]|uniref:ATP-binding protein n=1 Tax=Streptomyces syringium TaxID=76729 RepID=UPI00343307CC
MPCEPASARRARLLVSAALSSWGIDQLSRDGQQVVSELVGNTIDHTRCRAVRVTVLRLSDRRVRISVFDRSLRTPEMRRPCASAEGGRGLVMVEALSQRWGYDRRVWGKIVWAELLVESSA